jgi:hypothetical protein
MTRDCDGAFEMGETQFMSNQFSIQKMTIQSGWFDLTIFDEDKETVLSASYLSDAISDFIDAILLLCEGAKKVSFFWMNEPGETQWSISRNGKLASIKVVYSLYNERTMEFDEEVLFNGQVSLVRLAREVLRAMNRLNIEYPKEVYRSVWHKDYAYPEKTVHRLSDAIKTIRL